jgi:putative copper export protein
MPAIIIIAFVIGLVLSLSTILVTQRSVRKKQFRQPDRDLITFKLQMQYVGRVVIGAQILLVLAAIAVLTASRKDKDGNTILAVFIFVYFLLMAARRIFSQLKIGVETELEYRRLHPQAEKKEREQT